MLKTRKEKRLKRRLMRRPADVVYFGTCPLCGSCEPFHSVRVIRLFSRWRWRKGKVLLYCKNARRGHRFLTMYDENKIRENNTMFNVKEAKSRNRA